MHRRPARFATWLAPTLVALGAALVASCGDGQPAPPADPAKEAPKGPAPAPLPEGAPKLQFEDHAQALGLVPQFSGARSGQQGEDLAGGVAVADLDGDGRPDLLVVGAGKLPQGGTSRLYRNETELRGGTLALKDVTKDAGLPGVIPAMGVAIADTDGDGDLDVVLTCVGGLRMLRNDGGMRFSDVTNAAGLGDANGWCMGATFGDADGDGDLDLYVCRYAKDDGQPAANLLFSNNGEGRFDGGEALAKELGVDCAGGRSLGALFDDFDLDGLPDLCVAGESGFVAFSGTKGDDGRRAFARGGPMAGAAASVAAADGDEDGRDDLFVTHRATATIRHCRNVAANGRWMFLAEEGAGSAGGPHAIATSGVTPWALDLGDFDLDGRPDVFAAGGSESMLGNRVRHRESELVAQRSLVFWNAGPGRGFLDVGPAWGAGWNTPRVLRGGAAADLDGDGDPDVVFGALDGPPAVLLNEGDRRGRPLCVALRAPAPNTFGVGARVTVKCDGREQSREMRSSPGYLSAGPLVLLFGLGDAKGPATISVRWPDGTTSENTVDATERWPVVTKSSKR